MASRRENRMAAAQNDALMEFENFKKKYLLVNKHVTKLNSTLSVRVEELNDQLAMLQLENIRLRSANISLSAQLKRERQLKGRGSDPKTVALIDAATTEALRQLTAIRNALVNGNSGQQSPPTRSIPTPPSTSPAARIVGPVHPGQNTRVPVARAPEFPPLVESSESARSVKSRRRSSGGMTTDEEDAEAEPRITKRTSHGIPTPSYLESESEAELESKGRRRAGRQSALLARNSVVEEDAARDKSPVELTVEVPVKTKFKSTPAVTESKRSKRKLVESEPDDAIKSVGVIVDLPDEEEDFKPQHARPRAVNKLQDVTNSPRKTVGRAREKGKIVEDDDEEPVMIGAYMGTPAINKTQLPRARPFIPTVAPPSGRLTPTSGTDEDPLVAAGRERRARKSVNYAEPKLNTKMRKPAPDATSYGRFSLPTSKPRISTSIPRDSSPPPESPMPPLLDPETKVDDGVTVRARRRRPTSSVITDDDDGAEGLDADDDFIPGLVRRKSGGRIAADRRHSTAV